MRESVGEYALTFPHIFLYGSYLPAIRFRTKFFFFPCTTVQRISSFNKMEANKY